MTRHRLLEVAEVVANWSGRRGCAVGQKENAFLQAALPQTLDDLEGGVGLAGAGRHDEEMAIVALVRAMASTVRLIAICW